VGPKGRSEAIRCDDFEVIAPTAPMLNLVVIAAANQQSSE
jgi:hypothetical protein